MNPTYYSANGMPADLPEICYTNFLQVDAADYLPRIKGDLETILPPADLARLRELAELEGELVAAAVEFSDEAARHDHEAAERAAQEAPSTANLARLKKLGSLEVVRAHFHEQRIKFEVAGLRARREALPIIDAASRRLISRLEELAVQALREESTLFEAWGVPSPASRLVPHVHRAMQEIAENLRRESLQHPCGVGISGFLSMLGLEN